jgi:hypothetical protein
MKAKEWRRLALLGMAAGALAAGQSDLEAQLDENAIDLEHVLAKPSCKAHGGCGGLTASRDLRNENVDDEESLDGDEDEIDESPDGLDDDREIV